MNLWPRPNYYDLLKAIAILLMIVDHVGYFFFPEFTILRVIGRISMPLFLFLVGYNRSWRLSRQLLFALFIADGALLWYNMTMWYGIVGSILWSILIVKLIHRSIKYYNCSHVQIVWWWSLVSLILLLLNHFFSHILDYGTLAISIGICWLILWNSTNKKEKTISFLTISIVMLVYFITQIEVFQIREYIWLLSLLAIVRIFLIVKLPITHHTYHWIPGHIIKRWSQYSLHIYVIHIAIFAIVSYFIL